MVYMVYNYLELMSILLHNFKTKGIFNLTELTGDKDGNNAIYLAYWKELTHRQF